MPRLTHPPPAPLPAAAGPFAPSVPDEPRRWVLLVCACAVLIATYACFFNLTPLYPRVGADLGLDPGALGALVGIGGIVALLAQIPAGSGGDAFGRRPFFVAGMLCLVLTLLLRWQAQQPLLLMLGQVAAGVALGCVAQNAFALVAVADTSAARRQGQAFGIVNASINIGQVVGYLVAGTVGAAVGWHVLSLDMLVVPLLVLLLVARVPDLGRSPTPGAGARPSPRGMLASLGHPRRLALAALAALTLASGSGAAYLMPFAVQTSNLGPLAAALVLVPYVLGSVICAPFSGVLAERFGMRRLVVTALVLGMLACGLLYLAGTSILMLALCNVLIGASVNTTLPLVAVQAVTMRTGGASIGAGTALAGLRAGQSLGPFLGPTIAGAALARLSLGPAWLALAVCLVLSLGLYLAASGRE